MINVTLVIFPRPRLYQLAVQLHSFSPTVVKFLIVLNAMIYYRDSLPSAVTKYEYMLQMCNTCNIYCIVHAFI